MDETSKKLMPGTSTLNPLLSQLIGMTQMESKLFTWMLYYFQSQLISKHPYNDSPNKFGIPIHEITPQVKDKDGYRFDYEQTYQACKGLIGKTVDVTEFEADYHITNVFASLHVDLRKGYVTGYVTNEIFSIIVEIVSDPLFRIMDFQILMQLKSRYTHRLYLALRAHREVGTFSIMTNDLRELVFAQKDYLLYFMFGDFKRSILEPALKELCDLGWNITYSELKKGNKIIGLNFLIPDLPMSPLRA